MKHEAAPKGVNLSRRVKTVDYIESVTGLDFLHELPDDLEDRIEATQWELWPDLPGGRGHPPMKDE